MHHKNKARAYVAAVSNYDASTIEHMVEESYIQHNPFVPTGRAAFLDFIPRLEAHGAKIRNIRMLEDGAHVIMHHRWENAAPFGHSRMAAFHIIRFNAEGRIAEHWSLMAADPGPGSLTDGETELGDSSSTRENKARIAALFETLRWAPHNLAGAPFASPALRDRFAPDVLRYRRLHKIFGEGNFVLAISEGREAGVEKAVYDLFRLSGARVAEHWRISQEIPRVGLANNNTMFGF